MVGWNEGIFAEIWTASILREEELSVTRGTNYERSSSSS